MVGWGFAFGRGVVIFLWTIVWAIVAGIIAVLITGGTLAAVIRDPTAVAANPIGFLAAFSLGIFLAVFIATIGVYASIVKVSVDGALSQLEKSGRVQTGSSSIGSQPTLAAPSLRKYCPNCGTSLPGGTVRCPTAEQASENSLDQILCYSSSFLACREPVVSDMRRLPRLFQNKH